jgi:hypothetical protein
MLRLPFRRVVMQTRREKVAVALGSIQLIADVFGIQPDAHDTIVVSDRN